MIKEFVSFLRGSQLENESGPVTLADHLISLLKNDCWYRKLTEDTVNPFTDEQMSLIVNETYANLAPLLCEFTASVQAQNPIAVKICPFRSGQIYFEIARTIYSGRVRNLWQCFDYPRFIRNGVFSFASEEEYRQWRKNKDVRDYIINPKEVVIVDVGFQGTLVVFFDQVRNLKVPAHVARKTTGHFLFASPTGKTQLGRLLAEVRILPPSDELITGSSPSSGQNSGILLLAQIAHDATRGLYGPTPSYTSQIDTIYVEGAIKRSLHSNPWVYARNFLVNQTVLAYAGANVSRLRITSEVDQSTVERAIEWAASLTLEELEWFTLMGWEKETTRL